MTFAGASAKAALLAALAALVTVTLILLAGGGERASGALFWLRSPIYPNPSTPQDAQGDLWYESDYDDGAWGLFALPDTESFGSQTNRSRFYRFHEQVSNPATYPDILFASDDGIFLYVNGAYVGAWGFGDGCPGGGCNPTADGCVNLTFGCTQTRSVGPVDISPYLHSGDNLLAFRVNNASCCGTFFNFWTVGSEPPATPVPTSPPTPTPVPTPPPTPVPTPPPTPVPTPPPTSPPTPTKAPTPTPNTPTPTPTKSPMKTPTSSPTKTPTPTPTPPPPTKTPTPKPTTPTPTKPPTATPTDSPTPTLSPTPKPTPKPTPSPSPPSPPITPTKAPSPTVTATPRPTPTPPSTASPVPTPSPTVAALAIPTRSRTPTPSPTFRPTPTPTETPAPGRASAAPTVLGVVSSPAPSPPPETVATPPPQVNESRPEFVQVVRLPFDISTNPGVTATNAGLAILTLVLLLFTAEIFNQTLEENDAEIRRLAKRVTGPLRPITDFLSGVLGTTSARSGPLQTFLPPALMLSVAAFIYGFQEPDFGLNEQSLVLLISFLGAFSLQVAVYEGGQKLISNRNGWPGAVRVFPAGVLIAVVCVTASRIENLEPGLVYGFVAAHAFTAPVTLTKDEAGKHVFFPAAALIALAIGAWLLSDPLRSLAEDHSSTLAAIPEGIAVGLFVSAIQSVFFQMIPIQFMDGHKIMAWNKLVWFGMAALTAFLFWHVLLNGDNSSFDALDQTNTIAALVLLGIAFGVTLAVYLFFRIQHARQRRAAA